MRKKIVFISDFFSDHGVGGAELNDTEIIEYFSSYTTVSKIQSHLVKEQFLDENKDCFYIISNFCNLSYKTKEILIDKLDYIIYEHDHKYLNTRNPAGYRDYKADVSKIINYFFYKNAKNIFCQSDFHEKILKLNLEGLDNIINVNGNLWSLETLKKIEQLAAVKKNNKCSIMNSPIAHKNTNKCIDHCNNNDLDFVLVEDGDYISFLNKLGANDTFVFLPSTPETLSRLVVEARMMNMKIITNDLIGATKEDWFSLKGVDLIEYMRSKRDEVFNILEKIIEKKYETKEKPLVSILSTFYEGEKFLEGFLKNITEQTMFDKCELVLVDTGSPGKESEIVKNYTKKYKNIKYIRYNERYTPSKGTRLAIQNSSGKYLNFACLDDRKSKDSIEILFNELNKNEDIDLVYGQVFQTDKANETFENNSSDGTKFDHSTYDFSRVNMIKCLPGPMPMWKRSMHEKNGFFIEAEDGGSAGNDWEMWLRSVENGAVFKKIDQPVGLYMTGGRSQQKNNIAQRRHEAKIFFKYSHIFGYNYKKFKPYFDQFTE